MTQPGFTRGNRYLFDPCVWCWNLPSGYTCPGARECLAYADRETGKVKPGQHARFRCYSAVTERFPGVREKYWANRESVWGKSADDVAAILTEMLPRGAKLVRIHAAGDFFSQDYFDGWLEVCRRHPAVRFWAFTKSVPFWVARLGCVPENLALQASWGGKHDHLIDAHGLKSARVVYSAAEAESLGLQIDTDDKLAAFGPQSFALLENFTRPTPQATLPMAL